MRLANLNTKVNVKVVDIIKVLETNLAKHKVEYEEARLAYFNKVSDKLKLFVIKAETHTFDVNNFNVSLAKPVDASEMYEQYIRMFSISVDETIEIDTHTYSSIFEDQWDWALAAKATNSTYSSR